MSDMGTEPPDGTLRPIKSSFPNSNDESMADYKRMKPFELCSALKSQLQQQLPDFNHSNATEKPLRATINAENKKKTKKESH
ncbi:hypothetical protein TNCV_614931 [Trichonephila clavipes]|nr:hypothetical protein TNCV_614931 [Trichonephila clavipes]